MQPADMLRFRLLLTALLGLLVIVPSAQAAEPGLNMSVGGAADVGQLSDLGAKWARHYVNWDQTTEANLAEFGRILAEEDRRGIKTLFVVSSASATPPSNPQGYADFTAALARRFKGSLEAIEVWNEPDEGHFWRGGPQIGPYVDLLQRSYTAIKAANPAMTVVFGPMTGANYGWLEQAYAAGAKGFFDAVAAHTDTACLVAGPSSFYRDNGRIARYTFLGYRELRAVMLANDDPKPIWLTEIGWSAAQHSCERGMWAGQKAAGVTEAQQAAYLLEAFHCLKEDPYVQVAMWFNNRDILADQREEHMYGLLRHDGTPRPAWAAFQSYARVGDRLSGPCGDFGVPTVQILSPTASTVIGNRDPLTIRATSSDKDILRMTFALKGAPSEIRNFTNKSQPLPVGDGVKLTWQGAKKLGFGTHTIVVTAVDAQGNVGSAEVAFRKVNPLTLPPQATKIRKPRLLGSGRVRTLTGRVTTKLSFSMPGKVLVEWQNKRKGKWKKIHGAAYNANKPFKFKQRLRYKGQWRVRTKYVGKRPFRSSRSAWIKFKVR